jgi:hypothetical protein
MSRKPLRVTHEIGRGDVTKLKVLADRSSTDCCEIDLVVSNMKAPTRVCFIRTFQGIRKLGQKTLSRELFEYCFGIALKVMNEDGAFLAELRRKEVERKTLNLSEEDYEKLLRQRLEQEADETRRFAEDNDLGRCGYPYEDEAAAPPPVRIKRQRPAKPAPLPLFGQH